MLFIFSLADRNHFRPVGSPILSLAPTILKVIINAFPVQPAALVSWGLNMHIVFLFHSNAFQLPVLYPICTSHCHRNTRKNWLNSFYTENRTLILELWCLLVLGPFWLFRSPGLRQWEESSALSRVYRPQILYLHQTCTLSKTLSHPRAEQNDFQTGNWKLGSHF